MIDAIASYQPDHRIRRNPRLQEFQLWTLKVSPDKTAVLECREDSNLPPVITQAIEYTDFDLAEVKLYVVGGVLMLPGEY